MDRANVFIDRGVSGQLDPEKRPQFGMLQRTLQDGDTLIVAAFDRLSRVMKHQGRIFRDMARANIHLRSLADREQALSRYTELPPEDLMTETIRDVLITLTGYQAEMELEALSNRTRQGQAPRPRRREAHWAPTARPCPRPVGTADVRDRHVQTQHRQAARRLRGNGQGMGEGNDMTHGHIWKGREKRPQMLQVLYLEMKAYPTSNEAAARVMYLRRHDYLVQWIRCDDSQCKETENTRGARIRPADHQTDCVGTSPEGVV